jgi:hypothetical protein
VTGATTERKVLTEEDHELVATFDFEAWKVNAARIDELESQGVEDDAEKLWLEVWRVCLSHSHT